MDLFQQTITLLKDKQIPVSQKAKEFQRMHANLVAYVASLVPSHDAWRDANEKLASINRVARSIFVPNNEYHQ